MELYKKISIFLLLVVQAAINADTTSHSHGERVHSHPLPIKLGIRHQHGSGLLGGVINHSTKNSNNILGLWGGIGIQNRSTAWSIKLKLQENNFSIDYPSIPCGGKLFFIKKTSNKYIFREEITKNKNRCTNSGKLVLSRIDEHSLKWEWKHPQKNKTIQTILKRYSTEQDYNFTVPSLLAEFTKTKKYSTNIGKKRTSLGGIPFGEKGRRFVQHSHNGQTHAHRLSKNKNESHKHKGPIKFRNCAANTLNVNYKNRCAEIIPIKKVREVLPKNVLSVTKNPNFINGISGWTVDKKIHSPAVGDISLKNGSVTLSLDSNSKGKKPSSSIELSQKHVLRNSAIDDFYLDFYIDDVMGGAGGHPMVSCVNSGGFSGVYVLFRDINKKQIGLLAWSDHCNKFDLAWGGVANGIYSSNQFYNERLRQVIRRVNPKGGVNFDYLVSLGDLTKENIPQVYSKRSSIYSIEYGLFSTERRSSRGCYHCKSIVRVSKINLLRKN